MHRPSRQPGLWCFIEAKGIGVLAQTGQSYRHTLGVMDLLLFQARPTGHDFVSLTGVE